MRSLRERFFNRGKPTQSGVFIGLFSANIFFSFHVFLTVYMNSTYLSQYVGEQGVGLIFMAGSILAIVALYFVSKLLQKFGNYWLILWIAVFEVAVMLGMAMFQFAYAAIALMVLLMGSSILILYLMDIFLETYSTDEGSTGSIRGTYLTITNTALLLSPLIVGLILDDNEFWKIYLLGAIMLIPFILIIEFATKHFKDPQYRTLELLTTVKQMTQNKNLFFVTLLQLLLRVFISWVVIYLPIYLTQEIGFTWTQFGVMLSIGLLPLGLFTYPLGWLADNIMGEKELIIIGFLIIAATTATFSFLTVPSFLMWVGLIFLNRTGVSMAEGMTETYFFKHVDGDDSNLVSVYRMMRPFGFLVGSILGTIILALLPFQYIFVVLGGILILGCVLGIGLKDTR